MSLSRAEVESMDRDELVETLVELSQTLEDLQAQVTTDFDNAGQDRAAIRSTLNTLEGRVDTLEAENQRLRERVDDTSTKQGKVAAIVEFADNAREPGQPAIKLTAKEIAGAADISKRYAYDLMDGEDGLPAEYDWFLTPDEMRQYGSLEMDNDDRRLGIDFEGVHSTGCPLNKFNNGFEGEGGQ